jgi:hypothetical protein
VIGWSWTRSRATPELLYKLVGNHGLKVKQGRKGQGKTAIHVHIEPWLLRTTWTLNLAFRGNPLRGATLKFACSEVVQDSHTFLQACRIGDLNTVKQVCKDLYAVPDVVNASRMTPLLVSLASLEVVSWLTCCSMPSRAAI